MSPVGQRSRLPDLRLQRATHVHVADVDDVDSLDRSSRHAHADEALLHRFATIEDCGPSLLPPLGFVSDLASLGTSVNPTGDQPPSPTLSCPRPAAPPRSSSARCATRKHSSVASRGRCPVLPPRTRVDRERASYPAFSATRRLPSGPGLSGSADGPLSSGRSTAVEGLSRRVTGWAHRTPGTRPTDTDRRRGARADRCVRRVIPRADGNARRRHQAGVQSGGVGSVRR
jgi:hypothetical protein